MKKRGEKMDKDNSSWFFIYCDTDRMNEFIDK